jgi:hypothetical protein
MQIAAVETNDDMMSIVSSAFDNHAAKLVDCERAGAINAGWNERNDCGQNIRAPEYCGLCGRELRVDRERIAPNAERGPGSNGPQDRRRRQPHALLYCNLADRLGYDAGIPRRIRADRDLSNTHTQKQTASLWPMALRNSPKHTQGGGLLPSTYRFS